VHADRGDPAVEIGADALSLLSLSAYLAAFHHGAALSHEQMARSRMGILMGVGLGAQNTPSVVQ
jgi:hypothetical protein